MKKKDEGSVAVQAPLLLPLRLDQSKDRMEPKDHHDKPAMKRQRTAATTAAAAVEDEPPLYFDFNATTPLAPEVSKVISTHLTASWGNPSSGHVFGVTARKVIEEARGQVAAMIEAEAPEDIVFVSGGTEANNLVFHSVVEHHHSMITPGTPGGRLPHIIISAIEHDSVVLPLRHQEEMGRIKLTELSPGKKGFVAAAEVKEAVTLDTVLVSIMLANNETGLNTGSLQQGSTSPLSPPHLLASSTVIPPLRCAAASG